MFKGVFFDVGGTLYSYARMEALTREFLVKFAKRFPRVSADQNRVFGEYYSATKHADSLYAVQPFYLFADYFQSIFDTLMQRLDLEARPADFDWFRTHQIDTLIDGLDLKPDCHATLDTLRSRGLYLSAVSNADDDMLRALIERGDLDRRLDHWTSSEAARSCKPDRRFFEMALRKAGLQAEEVLFVGDSIEQDVQGAHRVGMTTVLITEGSADTPMHLGTATVEPDYRISQLGELLAIVNKSA